MPRVPTTKEVVPGAYVNIVLKADQPTGRTVAGTVGTLLTRGNHPRGIKVRLTDGRVGRVQSIGPGGGSEGSEHPSVSAVASSRRAISAQEVPSEEIGLDAYITQPRQRGKRKGKNGGNNQEEHEETRQQENVEPLPTVICPVCGDFTGDEAAVAHHVSNHFAD
ncbi:YwbE family protein [Aspergillus stella-maris]|uniref:YwbE family protein n=1 Tax=Aspergillus stella-maris TaxID=1810926 RepID=UPI003CCD76ED